MLGKDELEQAIADRETLNILCHFCNTKYSYKAEEIRELIAEMK